MPQLSQRLKKSRRFKKASQKWLLRQINDEFVEQARSQGWRSRAAFKIIEIDEKFKIFKKNKIVIDLGSAPGGWSQYAVQKVGAGNVLALDLIEMPAIPGVKFMAMDFLREAACDEVRRALREMIVEFRAKSKADKNLAAQAAFKEKSDDDSKILSANSQTHPDLSVQPHNQSKIITPKCDVVLTDMAANSTGDRSIDHLRIINLLEEALILAEAVLSYGGSFVGKIFQGGGSDEIIEKLQQNFSQVRYFKPKSSRKESSETYLVATGFKKTAIGS